MEEITKDFFECNLTSGELNDLINKMWDTEPSKKDRKQHRDWKTKINSLMLQYNLVTKSKSFKLLK